MVFVSFLCDNILTQRYWDKVLNHSFNQLFCICSVLSPRDKLKEYCIRCWMARTEWQTKICFVIWFLPFHFLSNILLICLGRQHKVNQFDCWMSTSILCFFISLYQHILTEKRDKYLSWLFVSVVTHTVIFRSQMVRAITRAIFQRSRRRTPTLPSPPSLERCLFSEELKEKGFV